MTYLPDRTNKLEVAVINWTADGALNVDATLTLNASTWANPPVISSNTMVLPGGHYRFVVSVGLTRTAASQNVRFAIFENGTQIGVVGQSDMYQTTSNQGNVDQAEAVVSVPAEITKAVSVRIIAREASMPSIVAQDSTIVIWRTNL